MLEIVLVVEKLPVKPTVEPGCRQDAIARNPALELL
jgi:hypothetical protein